ncbi:MAG TPA: hypothetical protein VHJ17_14195 [Thermomonospora sp.]|nr:hypothetical protein [Thermomonospora sp.]
MKRIVRRCLGALGAAALLGTAACGSEEPLPARTAPAAEPRDAPTTRLLFVLSQIRATDDTRRHVAFTDLEALRRLPGGRDDDALNVGAGALAGFAHLLAGPTGIDLSRASAAVQTGHPPTGAGRLNGPFDAATVGPRLTELGYRPVTGVADAWEAGSGEAFNPDDPLTKIGIPPVHDLSVIRVDSGEGVTFGRRRAALDLVPARRGAGSLAADPGHRAVAQCLGPVVSAMILQEPGRPDLVGVGIDAQAREILCVRVAGDAAGAAGHLRRTLGSGRSQQGTAWSELLTGAAVDQPGNGIVRLTATSPKPGVLFGAVVRNDLPAWRS